MTSDAKIGLLLGLVFIFVIAFIINGLPNFGDHSKAEAAPRMMVTETDSVGLTGNTQKAQEQLGWDGLLNQEGDDLTVIPETESDPESTAVPVTPDDAATNQDLTVADDGEIRSFRTLDDLVGGMSGKIQKVVQSLIEPTPGEQTTTEPAPVIASTESEPAPSKPVEAIVKQLTTPEPKETPKPAPTRQPATTRPAKIYVVEEGDVLATVAKKAYGPEEGNRLVNIDRIFKANRDTLETPDKIVVGQKLIIPPLPQAEKADAQLSNALFEKVEKIGKRNVAEVKDSSPKSSGRLYVVQDGDSLWKIASSQLDSGARWEEIIKLNADQLKSEDATLTIGMKLKLPAK